jgi:site-specific recombinase XerD
VHALLICAARPATHRRNVARGLYKRPAASEKSCLGPAPAPSIFMLGGGWPLSGRQLTRLLKGWVVEAGLDPTAYGIESLRRTKALHILKGTGDLQTVRVLLGHAQIESTARYLGLKTKADPIAVCRAFDI